MNTYTSNPSDHVGPSDRTKWLIALGIATVLLIGSMLYIPLALPGVPFLQAFSFALASSASFMFALSLSASSFSYYIGWPNMKDGYQKQIGVMAYWLALVYTLTLPYLYPELYWYGLKDNLFTPDVILGTTAMVIFTAMTAINSKFMSQFVTWDTIKFVLSLGFVAYAMLIMRAVFIEWPLYEEWFRTLDGFPPGRLVLSVVGMGVLFLRLSIPAHIALTKKPEAK